MTLNEVYVYLKMNGLPVTFSLDDSRIRLEGSTAALDNIVFLKVYKRIGDTSCSVASSPSVWLSEATYRDLDSLVESYLEHCGHEGAKRVRAARLRYAIDTHHRQSTIPTIPMEKLQ